MYEDINMETRDGVSIKTEFQSSKVGIVSGPDFGNYRDILMKWNRQVRKGKTRKTIYYNLL